VAKRSDAERNIFLATPAPLIVQHSLLTSKMAEIAFDVAVRVRPRALCDPTSRETGRREFHARSSRE